MQIEKFRSGVRGHNTDPSQRPDVRLLDRHRLNCQFVGAVRLKGCRRNSSDTVMPPSLGVLCGEKLAAGLSRVDVCNDDLPSAADLIGGTTTRARCAPADS